MHPLTHIVTKKYLGQHFLQDKNIARKIVGALGKNSRTIVEIGPGTGVLTDFLLQIQDLDLYLVEVDPDLAHHLRHAYPSLQDRIITADFLKLVLTRLYHGPVAIIGNFPYNISSQIFFRVLEYRQQVHEVVGMLQKEVAERLVAKPGSKAYGILSVLLQAFYNLEYLFTVGPQVFLPPPKVQSAVIRLQRNSTLRLGVDEKLFFKVVKTGFQQRRKTLRNALKPLLPEKKSMPLLLTQRAEQLTVADFVALTKYIAMG
jgi:16S rRNA (adenine1518-N6/adenine1519-N6)-dimethyltransferase